MVQIVAVAVIVLLLLMSKFKASEKVAREVLAKWGETVKRYKQFHPIEASYVLAMICVESAGDPRVVGDENLKYKSTGLMQIRVPAMEDFNKTFGKSYAAQDLLTPWVNVEVGYGYLALRFRKWGDINKAIMAYNGGDGNVGSALTQNYLSKVLAYKAVIDRLGV